LQLTLIYLLLGIGVAAFGPTMMAFVAHISPATHLGRSYGWYTTALFSGLSLGPAAGGAVGQWIGLQPVFIVAAALVCINLCAVLIFMPSHKPVRGDGFSRGNLLSGILALSANRPLMGCWLATFGSCAVGGMFFTFIPLQGTDRGLNVGQIGVIYFTQSLVNAASRIPFGYVSDMVAQRKHPAIAGLLLIAFSIAGFGPATHFMHFMLAAVCLGAAMGLAFTSIGALIAETVEARLRGLAMGGYNTCIYIGLMTGSIALGPAIEAIGYTNSFFLMGAASLIFVIVFYFLVKDYQSEPSRPESNSE
jgi:MFS family permease